MNHNLVQQYLLAKPEAVLMQPQGDESMVFKVKHKMFATLSVGKEQGENQGEPHWWLNLKCDPDQAIELRETYPAVLPGYHMNKKLWNTVVLDGSVPEDEIKRMMDNSFKLVVDNMPERDQASILAKL